MAGLLEPFAGQGAPAAAERLVRHFGGLGRALTASSRQLASALGGDHALAEAIVAARRLFEGGLRERVSRSRVSTADPDYRQYIRLLLANSPTEILHATFVTHDWGYLGDERIAQGQPGQVEIGFRAMLARAFELGAAGVILAHNHPSGSATPSETDIVVTRRVADLAAAVGLALLDHLVVGAHEVVSMRERGLI